MYKATTSQHSALLFGLITTLMCAPSFAKHDDYYASQNGHAIVQDVEKPGTRIEFDEDQDEVYRAVQQGYFGGIHLAVRAFTARLDMRITNLGDQALLGRRRFLSV